MAQQKENIPNCSSCNQKLQVKVKFCPFCGTEYIDVKRQAEQELAKKQTTELENKKAEQDAADLERQQSEQREAEKKYQAKQDAKRQALEQEQEKRAAEAKQEELIRQQAELQRQKAVSPPPPPKPSVPPPPFQPAQPKGSSGKYIVIAFIVIIIVIVLVFSGEETPTTVQTEQTAPQEDMSCETAINEINNHLKVSRPSRALTIIQMYQSECKKDSQFIELAAHAESQSNVAKAKLTLAKEYLQKDNFDMAATAAQDALDIDSEVIGANELLQEIETLQQQHEQEQIEQAEPTEDMPMRVEPQVDYAAEERRRAEQAALAQQKADLERQKAELERQKVLERQRAEAANNQQQQRISTALVHADKALRMKDYGTAKRTAREILASSPNNAQALRILRQAEESEAKAFSEMVIE